MIFYESTKKFMCILCLKKEQSLFQIFYNISNDSNILSICDNCLKAWNKEVFRENVNLNSFVYHILNTKGI